MKLKWFFLFLLIGLPIAIYLFLQAFGQNRFDIPVYYAEGPMPETGCTDSEITFPYKAPLYFDSDSRNVEKGQFVVYAITKSEDQTLIPHLQTFLNRNARKDIVLLVGEKLANGLQNYDNVVSVVDSTEVWLEYGRCSLMMESGKDQLILCDKERQIRGYYDPTRLKEIDRLNTELEILKSNEKE